jgi:uncharacterized membrane protein YgdD (TMEM256/DUF423 family)
MAGKWIAIAALNGLIAVAAGAYAAHGLQLDAGAEAASWMETGSRYQMWHALALLAVALMRRDLAAQPWLLAASWAFLLGIPLFCFSLYLMALTGFQGLAWVTPIGGLVFLIGWAALALHGVRHHSIR